MSRSRASLLASGLLLLAGCGGVVQLEVVSDDCPLDDEKIFPGECGCGIAEERCVPLKSALAHRYAFDGKGAVAEDEVGGAHGRIMNAELAGFGQVHLARGGPDQYVDLPNGIISELGNATFEAWLIWDAPEPTQFWERIFDFGVSTAGEDQRLDGQSYLFLAPAEPRTAFRNAVTNGEIRIDATAPFPTDTPFHVAVVVDEDAQEMRLYLNAIERGHATLPQSLTTVEDVNNWLGRSQFAVDTQFGGSFLEFRIYRAALTEQQLATSLGFGDSPAFLRPPQAENDSAP
jgi:hypothetical protein